MPDRKCAFVYFMPDDAVFVEYHDRMIAPMGNTTLAMRAYLVIINHRATDTAMPYAEIVKSRYANTGVIGDLNPPVIRSVMDKYENTVEGKFLPEWALELVKTLYYQLSRPVRGITTLPDGPRNDYIVTFRMVNDSAMRYKLVKGNVPEAMA